MPKMLFLDLDGTLLDSKKNITPATYEVLQSLTAAGHILCFNSGRSIDNLIKVWKDNRLPLKNSYVIGYNGGCIYDLESSRPLVQFFMDNKVVSDAIRLAKSMDLHSQIYPASGGLIVSGETPELDFYCNVIRVKYEVRPHLEDKVDEPIYKCLFTSLYDYSLLMDMQAELRKRYSDNHQIMTSTREYLELFPKESGKGNAIVYLAGRLGIDIKDTMACGDAPNDITMLEAAGVGVAMSNGYDEVKAIADIVTKEDNSHDGLVPIIKEFFNV